MPNLENKFKSSEPPKIAEDEEADRIFAERQDEASKCDLTGAQKLENVQNQIKRLRAEQELKSVQDGYKSYQDAVIQLSNARKQLEEDRAKLPDITARETTLKEQEQDIQLRLSEIEKYAAEKTQEADNYFNSKKRDGDLSYASAMNKFTKEYNEKSNFLKQMNEELQAKITIYNENVEPFSRIMAKDSRLIYKYLTDFIFPILDNGTLKLFGTFNGKLELTRRQAKLVHDALYTDAIALLTIAEKIKEK